MRKSRISLKGWCPCSLCIPETSGRKHLTCYCRLQRLSPGPAEALTSIDVKTKTHRRKNKRSSGKHKLQLTLSETVGIVCPPEQRSILDYRRVRNVQPSVCYTIPARSDRLSGCKEIRGWCVYLSVVPAAVLGRKSAASHWRDAICLREASSLLSYAAPQRRAPHLPALHKPQRPLLSGYCNCSFFLRLN